MNSIESSLNSLILVLVEKVKELPPTIMTKQAVGHLQNCLTHRRKTDLDVFQALDNMVKEGHVTPEIYAEAKILRFQPENLKHGQDLYVETSANPDHLVDVMADIIMLADFTNDEFEAFNNAFELICLQHKLEPKTRVVMRGDLIERALGFHPFDGEPKTVESWVYALKSSSPSIIGMFSLGGSLLYHSGESPFNPEILKQFQSACREVSKAPGFPGLVLRVQSLHKIANCTVPKTPFMYEVGLKVGQQSTTIPRPKPQLNPRLN